MTSWQRGYCDGSEAASRFAYRVAPKGSPDYQEGWRAGFDDECRFRGWVSHEIVDNYLVVKYGRNPRL